MAFKFAKKSSKKKDEKKDKKKWKVAIVDDEKSIHEMTQRVIKNFSFDNKGLEILHAYSAEEGKELLKKYPDIALMLLDVVMETDEAGLDLARYIREDLQNRFVSIILRTGQPGQAPEEDVIVGYEINDYKTKTELTATKLLTTVISSLRSYRNIRIIEKNREGLERIIDSSAHLFGLRSLKHFASGVLIQLSSILKLDASWLCLKVLAERKDKFTILAGTGKFEKAQDQELNNMLSKEIMELLKQTLESKKNFFDKKTYIGYFATKFGDEHLLLLTGCEHLSEIERGLIRIFSSNVAIAFDNIYLNQEVIDTQKEVIFTLGEVVENRSKETANHVRRVAEFTHFIGMALGMDKEQVKILRLASPMHDVGKIGISDSILQKPGRLTKEEFEVMKNHSLIGHAILKNSKREILQTAAIIAHYHHERWDGKGYPEGLKGDQTPIFARITGVADVFDALSHQRVYKPAWSIDKVLDLFKEERGKQFDPDLVDVFIKNIDKFIAINSRYPDIKGEKDKLI